MGNQEKKMQQKLQSILFFTFLICAQISITTSLKLKSKIQNQSKTTIKTSTTADPVPTPAPVEPMPAPAKNQTISPALAHAEKEDKEATSLERKRHVNKHQHFGQAPKYVTHVANFATSDTSDPDTDNHSDQFNVHHQVPKNLTNLNDKVRNKLAKFHERLDQINDLKKENEERKIIRQLPSKPDGIDAIGILNFQLRHISRQSQNFNIKNVDEFEYAFNKARYNKSHVATVNGKTYKIKQIGNSFWYGAIVGH